MVVDHCGGDKYGTDTLILSNAVQKVGVRVKVGVSIEKEVLKSKKSKRLTLSDLPREDRPRERLLAHGASSLSVVELLAILLGQGTTETTVIEVAQNLLAHFGGLKELRGASAEQLYGVRGIGVAKACNILATFELINRIKHQELSDREQKKVPASPEEIAKEIRGRIRTWNREHFWVVSLNSRNKIVGIDEISVGTIDAALVHPRETFLAAIKRSACRLIVCHNHPSGDSEPSEEDVMVTKRLVTAGKVVGIQVLDHIIVTKNDHYSLSQNDQIKSRL